jgi:hypothetical protein
MIPREGLVAALDRLEATGAWSAEQAAALLAEVDRGPAAPAPPAPSAPAARRTSRLAEAAAYAGAVLVGVAGAVLVGQQWTELGRSGRVAVFAGVTVVLAAAGVAVAAVRPRGRAALTVPAHAVRRRLASTALTGASAAAAGTAALLVEGHAWLAAGATAVVAIALTQWTAPSAVSEVGALAAGNVLAGAVLAEVGAPATAVVLVLSALGAGWAALSWTPVPTVPVLALALGLAEVLAAGSAGVAGAERLSTPSVVAGLAVLGTLAVAGVAGYVRTARWPLAAAGALALAALVLRVTSQSLSPVLAVLLTGLVLLAASVALLLRGRSRDR